MRVTASAPLRIALAGGGTDLPDYATRFGGRVLSVAINLRVSVLAEDALIGAGVRVAHEFAARTGWGLSPDPYIAPSSAAVGFTGPLALASISPAPSGTGLGSSGAYGVALLGALGRLAGTDLTPDDVAKRAWVIERDNLGMRVGAQDQYLAALGGAQLLITDGVDASAETVADRGAVTAIVDTLRLYFTGVRRSTTSEVATPMSSARVESLSVIAALGLRLEDALYTGDPRRFGELLHEHWAAKRAAFAGGPWDTVYEWALSIGATGGKLVGAGGGGFLLISAPSRIQVQLDLGMRERGLVPVPFTADWKGLTVHDLD